MQIRNTEPSPRTVDYERLRIRTPPGARDRLEDRATTFRVPVCRAVKVRDASLGPPVRKAGGAMRLPLS
jgi:hypothetical protein